MKIITLLIVSTILGSTPFSEGSLFFGKCLPFGRKYKKFLKSAATPQRLRFEPLEILDDCYFGEDYPTCKSIKAIEFSPADDVVHVTLLKKISNNVNVPDATEEDVTVVNDPDATEEDVTVVYKKIGPTIFHFDENFPHLPSAFGLESVEEYLDDTTQQYHSKDVKVPEIVNSFLAIVNTLSTKFQIELLHMPRDKSYAIFRTENYQCAWIGWNSADAQKLGLTKDIANILSNFNITPHRYLSDHEHANPQQEEGESSGSAGEITSMFQTFTIDFQPTADNEPIVDYEPNPLFRDSLSTVAEAATADEHSGSPTGDEHSETGQGETDHGWTGQYVSGEHDLSRFYYDYHRNDS